MRFIHIADIHLGAKPDSSYPWSNLREREIYETFQKVITDCNVLNIDLLLIAGDLFHKQPLLRELKELNYMFEQLKHTKVVIIAGNHDYIGVKSNYISFSWCEQVFMLEDEAIDSIYFEDINTEVYGFSYHTRDIIYAKLDGIMPGVEERINILLAHGGDDRNLPMDKKRLLLSGFDYIALGHIHKPEQFSERMRYSGSLEPLDKNELGEHGYITGEITKGLDIENGSSMNSKIETKFISIAMRKYIKIDILVTKELTNGAVLDKVRDMIRENGQDNIYRLFLQGKRDVDILFDKETLITLGNVVEIVDDTQPDYDFMQLEHENSSNIIGKYINEIQSKEIKENLKEKVLYLGIEALLKARE